MEISLGKNIRINLTKLLETRLLITANSGGGKSWCIRKLLEETYGQVQHIVLDLEGEFATLRERFDYLLVGKGGEVNANIQTAELLAKKLLELNVSTIIDLSELKFHERILFVKRFLSSMIDSPKELWHSCIVVVDEAHQFCPESGKSESAGAVIDLMTRGRKRGFCGVLATQRISKLHKDACAEANNKLIGRTGLDIDMKRASEELGFNSKQQMLSLRDLDAGQFFVFGTAISKQVAQGEIGNVQTTHPKVGQKMLLKPSPTPKNIEKILGKLENLPKEAEEELKTKEDLQKKIWELQRELRAKPKVEVDPQALEKAKETGIRYAETSYKPLILSLHKEIENQKNILGKIQGLAQTQSVSNEIKFPELKVQKLSNLPLPFTKPAENIIGNDNTQLRAGAMRMLKVCAMFYPETVTKNQIAVLAGFTARGGTFNTYLSELKNNDWLREENGQFLITEEGLKNAGNIAPLPTDSNTLIEMWASKFRKGAADILRAICSHYPRAMTKEELAETTDFTSRGGTYNTYLSELRNAGLIEIQNNSVRATKWLMEH